MHLHQKPHTLKKIQLILANPCSEQWDKMQPDGAGRYCNSCEKHILDLTTKSDAELIQFFKKKKDNVCGRLLPSQLNRDLVVPPSKASWHWLLPLTMGAIAVSPAQGNELKPVVMQNDSMFVPQVSVKSVIQSPITKITIRGTVLDDQTGKPLKGVKVRQKGFENVQALTDSTGRFDLEVAEEILTFPFTFELPGYSRVESELNDGMVLRLSAIRTFIVGAVSTITLDQAPLYMIYSGKKGCIIAPSRFKDIPPDWIKKIEVLKDAAATAVYGAKGANGVILIEIKKAYVNKIDFTKKD